MSRNVGSNDIRMSAVPILEMGNSSFPWGHYDVSSRRGNHTHSIRITHELSGAQLIQNLLDTKSAKYGCIVASPRSAYREVHLSEKPEQEIEWNPSDINGLPMFTPMIICSRQVRKIICSNDHGVHKLWDKETVVFPEAARLAVGPAKYLASSNLQSLIVIVSDDELKKPNSSQFIAEPITSEDFYFRVRCHPNLAACIKNAASGGEKRRDILVHIVTSCMALLQRQFATDDSDTGWRSFVSLRALAAQLETYQVEHWGDPNFHPETAATILHPHEISIMENEND